MQKYILHILLSLFVFAGCNTTTEGFEQADVLRVSCNNISVTNEGKSITVKINSLVSYEILSSEHWTWITPSKKSGEQGYSEFTFTISENRTVSKRYATIIVQNRTYDLSHEISVYQSAEKPDITVSTSSVNIPADGGKEDIVITSNINWHASTINIEDWISLSRVAGAKGETTLTITGNANMTSTERTSIIKVTNTEYGITRYVNITQGKIKTVILYTSSDDKIVKPYLSDALDATITSNSYSNGQGIMVFNKPITSIGKEAFAHCNLTSITIPDRVLSIGEDAFFDCQRLKSITMPNSVISLDDGAFYGCQSLTDITIPDSVTSIGQSTFCYCERLISITIPSSVTSIDRWAFWKCTLLTNIYCKPQTPPVVAWLQNWDAFPYYYIKIYVPRNSVESYKQAHGWKDYANYIEGYDF